MVVVRIMRLPKMPSTANHTERVSRLLKSSVMELQQDHSDGYWIIQKTLNEILVIEMEKKSWGRQYRVFCFRISNRWNEIREISLLPDDWMNRGEGAVQIDFLFLLHSTLPLQQANKFGIESGIDW